MSIRHKFEYSWPEGVTPMYLHEWVNTLPQEEQKQFYAAEKRQQNYRSDVITEGKMYIDKDHSYIWSDKETATQNKPYDETWRLFWVRYLEETKTIFKIEEEEC